jgi:hypothetical protein
MTTTERIREADIIVAQGKDGKPMLVYGHELLRNTIASDKTQEMKVLMLDENPTKARELIEAIKGNTAEGQHRTGGG